MSGTIYLCDTDGTKLVKKKYRTAKYRQKIIDGWFKTYGKRSLLVIVDPIVPKYLINDKD